MSPCSARAGTSRACSLRASRSAPRFVRTKTSARSRSASSSSISRSSFPSAVTATKVCSTSPCSSALGQLRLDPDRVARVRAGQIADLAVERRREQHRLAGARQPADDPVDLGLEAHVEHPVGLVEDERPDAVERDLPALDQILEAPRRRDEDVGASRTLGLARDRSAAVDGRDAQTFLLADELELICHLGGELAGRHEHEHGRRAVARRSPARRSAGRTRGSCPTRSAPWPARRGRRARPGGRAPGSETAWRCRAARARLPPTALTPSARKDWSCMFCSTPWFGIRDDRPETPEGGTRSSISRDGPLPSVDTP